MKKKTHPAPRITARLGNSSKLSASSDVIPNSCKKPPQSQTNKTKKARQSFVKNESEWNIDRSPEFRFQHSIWKNA
jgi:hypothetical protein